MKSAAAEKNGNKPKVIKSTGSNGPNTASRIIQNLPSGTLLASRLDTVSAKLSASVRSEISVAVSELSDSMENADAARLSQLSSLFEGLLNSLEGQNPLDASPAASALAMASIQQFRDSIQAASGGWAGTGSGQIPMNTPTPVAGNQPPNAFAVSLSETTSASILKTVSCLFTPPADPQGDTVTTVIQWMSGGSPIGGETGTSLQISKMRIGDGVSCRVTASDGQAQTVSDSPTLTVSAPKLADAIGGVVSRMRLVGSRLYVSRGYSGLEIYDVATPATPVLLHRLMTGTATWDVEIDGNTAYLALDSGFAVANVDPLATPSIVTRIARPDTVNAVRKVGNVLVLSGEDELSSYDVTTPASPTALSSVAISSHDIAVSGSHVVVAAKTSGLRSYELAANGTFTLRDTETLGSVDVLDVAITGDGRTLATLDANSNGLRSFTLNASTGALTQVAQSSVGSIWPQSVDVDGSRAFVTSWDGGVKVINLSNPSTLPIVGDGTDVPGVDNDRTGWSVVVNAGHAFVSRTDRGIEVYDRSGEATAWSLAGRVHGVAKPQMATFTADRMYVASEWFGVASVNLQASPARIVSFLDSGENYKCLVNYGNHLIVGYEGWFNVIDVSAPDAFNNVRANFIGDGASYVNDCHLSGSHLTFGGGSAGFGFADVSTPNSAWTFSTQFINSGGNYHGIFSTGTHVFATTGDQGFEVWDVSNRASPALASAPTLPAGGWTKRVSVVDNIAMVAAEIAGIRLVDVSNPAASTFLSTLPTGGAKAFTSVKLGRHVMVPTEWADWRVFDVSNLMSPTQEATMDFEVGFSRAELRGGKIYVVSEWGGILIFE